MRMLDPVLLILCGIAPLTAVHAQAAEAAHRGWRPTLNLGAKLESDNNVFLLSPLKIVDIAAPSAGQIANGRFKDMVSATDMIATVALGLAMRGVGMTGRALAIEPSLAYARNFRNTARSNLEFGLDLQQDLPHQSRFRLGASASPSAFTRNYLSDAVDANADGVISTSERVYAAGKSSGWDVSGDYRLRVAKSAGLWLLAGAGYSVRRFEAPHEDRNLNGPTGTLSLQFDRGTGLEIDLRYEIASLTAPVMNRVVLLNEPDFQQDFNADADMVDLNVRFVTPVDRSRTEQGLAVVVGFPMGKKADLHFEFAHRWRTFSSTETYDVTNNGRRDKRNEFGVSLANRLSHTLRLKTGVDFGKQVLSRDLDPAATGEIGDYSKTQLSVGLSCACWRGHRAAGSGQ